VTAVDGAPDGADEPAVRGRLVPLREPDLTDEQRRMWQHLSAGRRGATAVRPEGFLTGPFDVLLRSPRVGEAVAALGGLLRYESDLDQRWRELVIVTVAARWRAAFAWLRHDVYARDAGLPTEAVAAIAAGRQPTFEQDGDRVVHAFVHQLVHTGAVDEQRYAAALALLGEAPLVELVALTGYYCLSSMLLNAFEVPLPAGAEVPWRRT
jgi:4-carboxymuconolactone decarboxylase